MTELLTAFYVVVWLFFCEGAIRALGRFFGFYDIIELPTWFFLGYWFVIQIFSGVGSLVAYDINQGGVAFFAHIGGFIFGYLVSQSAGKRS